MTVLQRQRRATGRIETGNKTKRLGSYALVAVLAIAVGVGAAVGISQIGSEPEVVVHDQAAVARGAGVGTHLSALWASGLAQSAAIKQAGVLQGRFESGSAQQKAMAQANVLQGRIESGMAQSEAIKSADDFREAWTMRGQGMADHLDELTTSGLATAEAYRR